jgi:hypothetical protein
LQAGLNHSISLSRRPSGTSCPHPPKLLAITGLHPPAHGGIYSNTRLSGLRSLRLFTIVISHSVAVDFPPFWIRRSCIGAAKVAHAFSDLGLHGLNTVGQPVWFYTCMKLLIHILIARHHRSEWSGTACFWLTITDLIHTCMSLPTTSNPTHRSPSRIVASGAKSGVVQECRSAAVIWWRNAGYFRYEIEARFVKGLTRKNVRLKHHLMSYIRRSIGQKCLDQMSSNEMLRKAI